LALEGVEDRTEGLDVLAQLRDRLRPLRGEPPRDVRLDLCAQAQLEVSVGLRGEVPGNLRGDHGAAREGDRDRRADSETRCDLGRDRTRQERTVTGFGEPHRRETCARSVVRESSHTAQISIEREGVEEHWSLLVEVRGLSTSRASVDGAEA